MRNKEPRHDEAALYDKHEESLLRVALYELERDELAALSGEKARSTGEIDDAEVNAAEIDFAEMDAFFARTQAATRQLIAQTAAREQRKRRMHDFSCSALRIAALVLVAGGLVGVIAATAVLIARADVLLLLLVTGALAGAVFVAARPSLRARVLLLLLGVRGDRGELDTQRHATPQKGRANWQDSYFPSYMPDGFVLTEGSNAPAEEARNLFCTGPGGRRIVFYEYRDDGVACIDMLGATTEHVAVHGQPALRVTKVEDRGSVPSICIAWAEAGRYFVVCAQTDMDTAMRIADGILKMN